MTRTLQIRDVPEDLHATICALAAQAGLSVSAYLLDLVTEMVTLTTMTEAVERARTLALTTGGTALPNDQAAVRQSREH